MGIGLMEVVLPDFDSNQNQEKKPVPNPKTSIF
jgi:hypothetical protein